MFKHNLKKVFIVFVMFTLVNMFFGCNSEKSISSDLSNPTSYENNKIEEYYCFEDENVKVFDIKSYSAIDYNELYSKEPPHLSFFVEKAINEFEEMGYSFNNNYTSIIEGNVVHKDYPDTIEAKLTFYKLTYNADTTARIAMVEHVETNIGSYVQRFIISYVEPDADEGFDYNNGIWTKGFLPLGTNITDSKIGPQNSSVSFFGPCWIAGSIGGCIAAGFACILSTFGWPACAGLGCGGSILGMEIGCAIAQMLFY